MPNPENPDEAECRACFDMGTIPGTYKPCTHCSRPQRQEDKHPDLVRIEERIAKAVERGYQHGDVNHLLQPIIGWVRMKRSLDIPLTNENLDHIVEKLSEACDAETALLAYLHPEKYGLG